MNVVMLVMTEVELIVRALLKTLILPPTASLLLALFAFLIWHRWPRLARASVVCSIVSLWFFSLPLTASWLMNGLERQYPPLPLTGGSEFTSDASAIVILGGGRRVDAREYGVDTVNFRTLERLRFGVQIHRATRLPILVSGGRVRGDEAASEAQLMAQLLRDEFDTPVHWQEAHSRTTAENALFSARLLKQQGIDSILLVTHAWHMPRAAWAFERAGLRVIAAPMGFTSAISPSRWWMAWLPNAQALGRVHYALHERLGAWIYRFSPAIDEPRVNALR